MNQERGKRLLALILSVVMFIVCNFYSIESYAATEEETATETEEETEPSDADVVEAQQVGLLFDAIGQSLGWDINDIKEWLGHADISTTANIYAHISHRKKVSLAKDLDKTLTFK